MSFHDSSNNSPTPSQTTPLELSQTVFYRNACRTPQLSVRVPSPRASSQDSFKEHFTPKILSRKDSTRTRTGSLSRNGSVTEQSTQGSPQTHDGDWRSPIAESSHTEVIETGAVKVQRDQGSGRWMINQYRVLSEIGSGTHGRQTMKVNFAHRPLQITHFTQAIKIVDRNPKRKRLVGLGRHKGSSGGAKLLNENEIRKEIAIFKKVNHPNVVRMKEIIDDPESSKIYMILEWCKNGEIIWKDGESQPALTVGETRKIFRDTLLGLEYLHHQGIIHRDIKPSNLLRAADDTVKISDFGCSHFSEALRVAASQLGPEGDAYVDDIELAKTAGSPAFFAPEMCCSGLEIDLTSRNASPIATEEIPTFTLRPPSSMGTHVEFPKGDNLGSAPLVAYPFPSQPVNSKESSKPLRPSSYRSHSSCSTIPRHERPPITNAIDVWALGVTFYCLLFGKTPFDAPNEYLLMQVIAADPYIIPPFMGRDRIPTGTGNLPATEESEECLDLLGKLLQKDVTKRTTLEQAKCHPFTLRGLSDATAWLSRTDPHTQTYVTVSNDEVAAAVTKSTGFRDRFRKGIKTISQKLQLLSGVARSRSRSIGDYDSPTSITEPSTPHSPNTTVQHTPKGTKLSTLLHSRSSRVSSRRNSSSQYPEGATR
nr:CAMKK/ELM protein kinase [Cryptococcus depauperatus CBS 7841]